MIATFLVSTPPVSNLWSTGSLIPLWLPVKRTKEVIPNKTYPIKIYDEPFVMYKDGGTLAYNVIYDVCPHQGASLSRGSISSIGTIVCPYHGFEFRDGQLCRMPSRDIVQPKIALPSLFTFSDDQYLYILPSHSENEGLLPLVPFPYEAPEKRDPSYVAISGKKTIPVNHNLVTENVLDMLHVSYVHSFGNREMPAPFRISFDEHDHLSGRTRFYYKSGPRSISRVIAGEDVVTVENEYHLPSTTVTRVIAGKLVKVVVTRALPVSESETILFWEIYRNFWVHPFIVHLGNLLIRYFMEQTLLEDITILKYCYPEHRVGKVVTKYDITIRKFRDAIEKFRQRDPL